ncbi:MAG: thioesterase family protein [Burkholderiales bacterium]|jgi:acyl-coenzyme A thioesterase PaaI-like protein|nr:thioesterase family protein [Burkholderiales bacterium]
MTESTRGRATDAHPFDAAVRLVADGDDTFLGATSPAYANMIGPYGGVIAATLLNAARLHPSRAGDPLALTVNFAGPLADGPFRVVARPARINRSTQHWHCELAQDDGIAATASAVFGARRETWSSTEAAFPVVPPADEVPPRARLPGPGVPAFIGRYAFREIRGGFPNFAKPSEAQDSESCLWTRDDPPRPIDYLSLASLADIFYPRIFRRRGRWTPASTVTLTTYFHADASDLTRQSDRHVLGVARASRFGNGYADQSAEVWADDGTLLATSFQLVYFKE